METLTRLSADIYKELLKIKDSDYRDQITRSGLSIPSNIAEGYERNTYKEKIYFQNSNLRERQKAQLVN